MHELSLCQMLLKQVSRLCEERQLEPSSITRINLKVGPLSGVEPELLERAFSQLSKSQELVNAQLHIETSKVQILCLDCLRESFVPVNDYHCSLCHSDNTQLKSGDECFITGLTVSSAVTPP